MTEACNELGSCYAAAVEAWKKHQEATKPLVEQWKVEFKSLHKIKCYVSVFMNDNDAKTVDASQYLFPRQGWIAARTAYWTTKENRGKF